MDDGDPGRSPFEPWDGFGESVVRASGRHGAWAAVNRVPLDGALWLVTGEDDDDGGSWSASPLAEPVVATLAGDELVIAGYAKDAARIEVLFDGKAHAATPQAEGIWLLLIGEMRGALEATVRAVDRYGTLIDETLVELPGTTGLPLSSMRARLRMWLGRGMRRMPRGTTVYGPR